jgi:F-type H+-transporting ATPase subunit delta
LAREFVAGDATDVTGMPGRYASALFDLAKETDSIEEIEKQLTRFEELLDGSPDLQRLVRSPVFSSEEQLKAITAVLDKAGIAVLDKAGVAGLAGNFIKLAAANRRLFAIRDMIAGFKAAAARARGEISAAVTVAEPLADKHLDALRQALREVTGKDVRLAVKVDPSILGGLVVQLGSRMVDTSLKTKLNGIRHAMKEVG